MNGTPKKVFRCAIYTHRSTTATTLAIPAGSPPAATKLASLPSIRNPSGSRHAMQVPLRGTRAGATGEPGPMPSGDVMPSGEEPGEMLIPPTCAKARAAAQKNGITNW